MYIYYIDFGCLFFVTVNQKGYDEIVILYIAALLNFTG